MPEEVDLQELSPVELLNEYRSVTEFRGVEQAEGQVSPSEMRLQEALEAEILRRME